MANLDYLKIGNCIKKSVSGSYSGNTQVNVVEISELKVNKKTAWVNGTKYEITGNKLYSDGGVLLTTLSEIDEQFAGKVKDNFDQELAKLEQSLKCINELVEQAKNAKSLIDFDFLQLKIKRMNSKILLNETK